VTVFCLEHWINRQPGIPYFFFCARIREVGFAGDISRGVWIERSIMSDADKLKARLRVVISNSQSIKESDNYLDSPVGEKKNGVKPPKDAGANAQQIQIHQDLCFS
jgi:hypothetical protein